MVDICSKTKYKEYLDSQLPTLRNLHNKKKKLNTMLENKD
jgi:hypothetical protein